MSQYLILSHIDVQNANSIAGLTWGFPAITHFLGFTHALSRKISAKYNGEYDTELVGCAVISNRFHNKVYQPKAYADFEFLQSKNPPVLAKHKKASPPIIEEGKMNLTVSLVIELSKQLSLTSDELKDFERNVVELCNSMRLAGGIILKIKHTKLLSGSTEKQKKNMLMRIKRMTMPGFVLLDKSEYLEEYYQALQAEFKASNNPNLPQLFDAWLDFSALKYKAHPQLAKDQTEPDENTPAEWKYVPKPKTGYLVPLMTGYKAISELYEPEDVLNTRYNSNDKSTINTCFVEAVHSVGEWKGMHGIKQLNNIIWRYQHDGQWYLCRQERSDTLVKAENSQNTLEIETQNVTLSETLNQF